MKKRLLTVLCFLVVQVFHPIIVFAEVHVRQEDEIAQSKSSREEINESDSDEYSDDTLFESETSKVVDSNISENSHDNELKQEIESVAVAQEKRDSKVTDSILVRGLRRRRNNHSRWRNSRGGKRVAMVAVSSHSQNNF